MKHKALYNNSIRAFAQYFERPFVECGQRIKSQGASNKHYNMAHLLHPFYKGGLLKKFELYNENYDQLLQSNLSTDFLRIIS